MKLAQALILVGGLGTRLQPVVSDVPKPMADVNGRPFLEYVINHLKKFGITNIVLATGYMHEKIESYFGNGSKFGVKITYSREPEPLGTGGAIKLANKLLSGRFLLVNGDTWFDCNLDKLEQEHEKNKVIGTLALAELKDTARYGLVITNAENKIEKFVEKGNAIQSENKINAGLYILEPEIFQHIPEGRVSIESDVFPKLVSQGKLYGISLPGNFIDIGMPEDYFKFKEFAKQLN